MSKVAAYLRGHINGEVSTRTDVREAMSVDGGVLSIKPEMVIYPRTTNDVRKVARFAWQLAEKGHTMPITVRGAGTDPTGGAIGKGASVVMTAHMNQIFEYDAKQKLVRLQPGATVGALNQALSLHGTGVFSLAGSYPYGTVGGAVASAVAGPYAGKYGAIDRAVEQLEVVLANGDVIQTGRISKRELNRRKGLQTFEGEIYRGIDGIIEEYAEVLDSLNANDSTGYNTVADVKSRDGSFDLTPLFIGSQGTLGIITEMIMKADYRSLHTGAAALVFSSGNAARDALDMLSNMTPALLEYMDAELFENALKHGRTYDFYTQAKETLQPESVVIIGFDDFSDRARSKQLKKVVKFFEKQSDVVVVVGDNTQAQDILAACDVTYYTTFPDHADQAAPRIFNGFHVPTPRLEDFATALKGVAAKHHVSLPMAGHVYTNTYGVYPTLELRKVGDKQKIFKILEDLTKLVYAHSGTMITEGGEGRLKTKFIYAQLDPKVVEMYNEIRKVCDPFGTLNPGVKQDVDIRHIAEMLRNSYDAGQLARFGL